MRALLAEAYLERDEPERAAAVLLPVRALLGPDDVGAMAALAALLVQTEKHEEALHFEEYNRLEKWFLVEYAVAAADKNLRAVVERAAEILAEQLKLFPDPTSGFAYLEAMADMLVQVGARSRAIALLESDPHFGLDHQMALARLDPTEERIERARDELPSHETYRLAVALLLADAGQTQDATELVQGWVPATRDVWTALDTAGHVAIEWAYQLYKVLPPSDPLAVVLAEDLVSALLRSERAKDAWEVAESSGDFDVLLFAYLQMPPGSLPPMSPPLQHPALVLAWCRGLVRQGHGKEATGEIFRVITADEVSDSLLVSAAELFIELGRTEAATELAKQCKSDVARAVITTGVLVKQ